ncbi:MAG: substrate-binding domain-containing protein, partial [Lachnospiraceae bacterium]|nr:substrate-binding domain-containing protein [Lachnospiraceae bacterium]
MTLLLCLAIGMAGLLFNACGSGKEEKVLYVYADSALETVLPLSGEKFNVLNGKNYKLEYVFESAEEMKNDISAGKLCDVFITDSSAVLNELAEIEKFNPEKCRTVAGNRLVFISNFDIKSFDDIFRVPEYDEEYGDYEQIEGFVRIDSLLPEEYWDEENLYEEDWEDYEEWEEELPPMLINETVSKIAICGPQSMEGIKSKELLDAYFSYREPIDIYDLIIFCNNDEEVIEAVTSGKAQAGICLETSFNETMNIQPKSRLTDRVIEYSAAPIIDCIHKEEAALFMNYIQGDVAKRYFIDFNFN